MTQETTLSVEFEAWLLTLGLHLGNHERRLMLLAYQAGRAAAQPTEPVKVNAIFETQDDEVIGTTDAKVKRVEVQDDGALTVVIDHWPKPVEPDKQHPDDVAVDAFAVIMKAKLKRARDEKGRGGWQDMSAAELSAMLREHVEKGDPVDVANLAMMLHQNGRGITPAEPGVLPGEAVFGFAAWLTSLKTPVTFSECHGAAIGADLAVAYNTSQGFIQVREDFHKRLKPYPKYEPSQPAEPVKVPPEKSDPWYEEGSTDVFDHAQRQAYVDGWNECREAFLKIHYGQPTPTVDKE